jgi:hypothetical protein
MLRTVLKRLVKSAVNWVDDPIAAERRHWPKFGLAEINIALLRLLDRGKGELRPHYTYGVIQAAHLARALQIKRISAIEFGVAAGSGLISLEKTAEAVEQYFGVAVDVYGFDTGKGLPKPEDYRDLPNLYKESAFLMDHDALSKRLQRAKLLLGLIEETLPGFIASRPAPVGFVAIDVDLYSSTMAAFNLLHADHRILLPRVHCFFDDIMGFTFSEFAGERLAISDFNAQQQTRKISPIFGLKFFVPRQFWNHIWTESFYIAHLFDHPLYCQNDGLVLHDQANISATTPSASG